MSNNNEEMTMGADGVYTTAEQHLEIDMAVANRVLRKSYLWMALALVVSATTGWYLSQNLAIIEAILNLGRFGFLAVMLAQVGLVYYLTSNLESLSVTAARALFIVYAISTGFICSLVLLIYTGESIATVFFVTAGMFAGISTYGYTTNKSLAGWASYLIPALFGIVIATVVNIFMESETLSYIISYIGVVVFSGLIAYDTQKLMIMSTAANNDEALENKIAVYGALTLYLDFMNLFLSLLRIFGKRK